MQSPAATPTPYFLPHTFFIHPRPGPFQISVIATTTARITAEDVLDMLVLRSRKPPPVYSFDNGQLLRGLME